MTKLRRFERTSGRVTDYWEIRCEGIRCHMGWGRGKGPGRAQTMTLLDDAHAQRHLERKVREKLRQGYIEVAPKQYADETREAAGKLLDRQNREDLPKYQRALLPPNLPVAGRDEVYLNQSPNFPATSGRRDEYFLLRDEGRSAVSFLVLDGVARPDDVKSFLDFLETRRDLAFDGRSHHKIALPAPIGRFTHALFCSPGLWAAEPPGRIAAAFPIFDCEIGDADTETFVGARINGAEAIPFSTLNRSPHPVVDLKFDVRPKAATFEGYGPFRLPLREVKMFKRYPRSWLNDLAGMLAQATPDSYVEIRSFRGDVKTVRPRDLTSKTATEIDTFLLGQRLKG